MECVYLLQEKDFNDNPTGLYKIGKTSKDAETRKRQYQAGNARRVDVYFKISVTDSQAIETELHRRLANYRLNYGGGDEWFDFSLINIKDVKDLMQEYDETIPVEPTPSYSYRVRSDDIDILTVLTVVAIVGGLAFFIIRCFSQLNFNTAKYYNQAYQPLIQYAERSETGQYNTAAINFKRMADSTANECLKTYGKNMASAALSADKKLKSTKNKDLAWNEFRRLQKKAWNEANCHQEIKKLGD